MVDFLTSFAETRPNAAAVIDDRPDGSINTVFRISAGECGETVHAVVVAQPTGSLNAGAVVGFARGHLADYKIPRFVSFIRAATHRFWQDPQTRTEGPVSRRPHLAGVAVRSLRGWAG